MHNGHPRGTVGEFDIGQGNCSLRNRLPVGGGCIYVLQLFFFRFFVFFPSTKTMRQSFSGTAERIFMKLSPNDRGGM